MLFTSLNIPYISSIFVLSKLSISIIFNGPIFEKSSILIALIHKTYIPNLELDNIPKFMKFIS